jgi:hypothetical protein
MDDHENSFVARHQGRLDPPASAPAFDCLSRWQQSNETDTLDIFSDHSTASCGASRITRSIETTLRRRLGSLKLHGQQTGTVKQREIVGI